MESNAILDNESIIGNVDEVDELTGEGAINIWVQRSVQCPGDEILEIANNGGWYVFMKITTHHLYHMNFF